MNRKVTSPPMASKAAKVLQDDSSSAIQRKLAASVLSQANKTHETGKEMETIASNVLKSEKYSEETKSLAASVLSQSDKQR